MKNWLAGTLAVMMIATAPSWSEAKRVGAGKSQGMQRNAPAQSTPQNTPPQQAAPQQAASPQQAAPSPAAAPAAAGAAAAAAAPAKRSWLGPIAGLAAGLGLAALMSHLGLGEAFANFLMLALLAVAVIFLVVFLMRRFGRGARQQPALATAGAGQAGTAGPSWSSASPVQASPAPVVDTTTARTSLEPAGGEVSVTGQPLARLGGDAAPAAPVAATAAAVSAPNLPEGFDLPAFERVAKMIFIRLQAANDAGDLDDLRRFTTPEMFAALRMDIQDRGATDQRTDVERVDAQVIDFATEAGRQIVSVRFHGLIREEAQAPAVAFDEVWHLVKNEGEGAWAIAGIQQAQ